MKYPNDGMLSSPIAAYGVSPSPNWEREGARGRLAVGRVRTGISAA